MKHVPEVHEQGEEWIPFHTQVEEVCKALDVERHQSADQILVKHIVEQGPKRPKRVNLFPAG